MIKLSIPGCVALWMLMVAGVAVSTPRAQEDAGARADDEIIADVFAAAGQADFKHMVMPTWWMEDLWATMAYLDRESPDAIMGYYFTSILLSEHHVFSLMPLGQDGAVPVREKGANLTNQEGVSVAEMPVHSSLEQMVPGVMIFPARDESGNELYGGGTGTVTMEIRYDGEDSAREYSWDLPLRFPDEVIRAHEWLEVALNADPETQSEDQRLFSLMSPMMKIDIGSGVIAAPMHRTLFEELMMTDPGIKDDALLKKLVRSLINEYTFFMIMSVDMEQNRQRLENIAATAKGVDSDGNTVEIDGEEEKRLVEQMDMGMKDNFILKIIPGLGNSRLGLMMKDPETGRKISFEWDMAGKNAG